MIGDALRAPIRDGAARRATAFATGTVLAIAVLLRISAGLWPSWLTVLPALLTIPLLVLFVGHLAAILRETMSRGEVEPIPYWLSAPRLALGGRTLVVAFAYLLVPAIIVAAGGFVIASGLVPAGAAGLAGSLIATVALLVVVAFTYVLPVAIAVATREGIRPALRRSSLTGLASGSYFVAWTSATVLAILGWGAVAFTTPGTVGGIAAVAWLTYAHLAAVHVLGRGIAAQSVWSAGT